MARAITLGVIPGDGIGRDVTKAARIVLDSIAGKSDELSITFKPMEVGERAVEEYGEAFPEVTRKGIEECDVILFGAIGAPHDFVVLSGIRYGFHLYSNVRPIKSHPNVDCLQQNADLVIIRENTEGLYKGVGYRDGDYHVNLRVFTRRGMERIIRFSFDWAVKHGRRKVTFTHKESVLRYTDAVMKELFYEIAPDYPSIEAEDMEIDACAMRVVMKPQTLDVVIAENANGDILSDVGGGTIGGLGLTPSGNIGDRLAMFEPVHGSAPKYADKDVVNPMATLLATKMMFDYLQMEEIGNRIERAIDAVLLEGKVRTYDLGGSSTTSAVAEAVAQHIEREW